MERFDFADYKCLQCGAAFKSQEELIEHNTALHSDTNPVPVPHP